MALNPVERRLADLAGHWVDFRSDVSKRLLVWHVPDNALRLMQCFFEAQKLETEYSTGDLFIVFDPPFQTSIQYSRALKETLAGQYEASREQLAQQGLTPDWRFAPTDFPDTASGFIQALRSFGSKHHKAIGHLVAVLMPQHVDVTPGFAEWLKRALAAELPERLRLVVIDTPDLQRVQSLTEAGHPLMTVGMPKIDTMAMAQETFAQEPTVGPAGVFRNHLMGLVTLIEKGTADQVKAKAGDALAFARRQNWADQEVAVGMLVAGALLKEKRFPEAVKIYQAARVAALKTVASGHPVGQQLVLQTWFGEAGAHFAAGDTVRAAECYDRAAPVAERIPNLILAIEAFRMAAFCHTRIDGRDAAVARGLGALSVGRRLKPDARAMTTLPLAAVDLLRLIEPERIKQMERIRRKLAERTKEIQQAAEQEMAALESANDASALRTAQSKLIRDAEAAQVEAAEELEGVAVAGGEEFRRHFGEARALLGEEWPLFSAVALPLVPESADKPAEEVPA